MQIPESMKEELQSWNSGAGVDLETWMSCTGNFSLAVGYANLFCPDFIEFEDYIFVGDEMCEQAIANVRGFEAREGNSPMSVEWVMNHFHIEDIHYRGCPDLTVDKVLILGECLKNIYEARLQLLFPDKPCVVEFFQPENPNDLGEYQLSFWQKKHDPTYA